MKGLGRSYNSDFYGMSGIDETVAYWQHPVLGTRLKAITEALLNQDGKTARDILGGIDAAKVKSSMTLFWRATKVDIFKKVLDKYYDGKECNRTLRMLGCNDCS